LNPTKGRKNIRNIVFETRFDYFVVPGSFCIRITIPDVTVNAVGAHNFYPLGDCFVPGNNHAPFSGGDGFCGVKRKNSSVTPGSGAGGKKMGCVFHNFKAVFFCDWEYAVHVARETAEMNRQHRDGLTFGAEAFSAGPARRVGWVASIKPFQGMFQAGRVHMVRTFFHIHENHFPPKMADYPCCGREGHGRKEHELAFFYTPGFQGKVKTGSSRIHRHAVDRLLGAGVFQKVPEIFFKLYSFHACGQPARTKHRQDGLFLFFSDIGFGEGNFL
jgi:hypothetical protein